MNVINILFSIALRLLQIKECKIHSPPHLRNVIIIIIIITYTDDPLFLYVNYYEIIKHMFIFTLQIWTLLLIFNVCCLGFYSKKYLKNTKNWEQLKPWDYTVYKYVLQMLWQAILNVQVEHVKGVKYYSLYVHF